VGVGGRRNIKCRYARPRSGGKAQFTGISDPYGAPESPEIVLHADRETPEESVEAILTYLVESGKLAHDVLTSGNHAYSAEEEALVEARLKNLGYL